MSTRQKHAIVLGGTHDHIRLIELLKACNYHTILVDYYDDPPARAVADTHIQASTLDMDAVVRIAYDARASLVVSACIDQAMLTMAYVCQQLNLRCHLSYHEALERTNKSYMKRLFSAHAIPTARWEVIQNGGSPSPDGWTWPLVVKPVDANSSKGVTLADTPTRLNSAIATAAQISRTGEVIVEEFKDGRELSVDVVVESGVSRVVMVSENIKMTSNSEGFTIIQNVVRRDLQEEVSDACQAIAERIAKAFRVENSPMLIQMIRAEDSLYVVEFSSRIGGGSKHHFIRRMTGVDILQHFVELLIGNPRPISLRPLLSPLGAMNYVYAQPGIFHNLRHAESLHKEGVIEADYLYKRRGARIEGHHSSTDRAAGFMTLADNPPEMNQRVAKADSALQVLDDSGRDIMLHGIYPDLN